MDDDKPDEKKTYVNPVLEYYQKYSRSKELPKYFRGSIDLTKEQNENDTNHENNSLKNTASSNFIVDKTRYSKDDNDAIDVDIRIELHNEADSNISQEKKFIDAETATDLDNLRGPSPTSSITSNRKLEWDNGADIGYEFSTDKNLHKSCSLPSLGVLDKLVLSPQQFDRRSPEGKPADISLNKSNAAANICTSTSESSIECDMQKKIVSTSSSSLRKSPIHTTSSSSKDDMKSISKTSSDDIQTNSLHKDVGNPIAESTPNIKPILNLKELTHSRKNSVKDTSRSNENLECKAIGSKEFLLIHKKPKELKLCVSKPMVLECAGDIQHENKFIQTSVIENVSTAVQTENSNKQNLKIIEKDHYKNPNYIERQNVIYIQHSDRTEEGEEGKITNSNSFEFIAGEQVLQSNKIVTNILPTNLQRSQYSLNLVQNNNNTTSASSSTSRTNSPLSNLLSITYSNNLIQDLEKSIDLLQQLLKSKKYDDKTKKFYLRKVVKKIIENKYADDSSLSSSNELSTGVMTERSREMLEHLQKNVPWEPIQISAVTKEIPNNNSTKTSSNESNKQRGPSLTQVVITKNLETMQQQSAEMIKKQIEEITKKHFEEIARKQGETKTKKTQVVAIEEIFDKSNDCNEEIDIDKSKEELIEPTYDKVTKPRHALFTITSNQLENSRLSSEKITVNSDPSTINEMHVSSECSSIKKTPKSSPESTGERRSWRDDKTLSEKLLEEKVSKYREYIGDSKELNLATFKKESQLNWINNEINHLHNLRKILEGNQEEIKKALLDKPHENFQPDLKATSVYVITTEKKKIPTKCGKTCNKSTQYSTTISMNQSAGNSKSYAPENKAQYTSEESTEKSTSKKSSEEYTGHSSRSRRCNNPNCTFKSNLFEKPCPTVTYENSLTNLGKTSGDDDDTKQKIMKPSTQCKCKSLTEQLSALGKLECTDGQIKDKEPIVIVLKLNKKGECIDSEYPATSSSSSSSSGLQKFCCRCKKCLSKPSSCYTHPNYPCNCYTYVDQKTINDIKNTIRDLDELERQRSMCDCKYDINKKRGKCPLCCNKRKSIAYTLNLEHCKKPATKKRNKNKLDEVTIKIPNLQKKCTLNEDTDESDESKENCYRATKKHKKKKRKSCTLQDYLAKNRPDFIKSAEERRLCMLELACLRARRVEKYKRLLALTSGISRESQNYKTTKLQMMYTTKEMKEITARTYKKLPEVQTKKEIVKKQQIEKANRLIKNIFNQKVRSNVLKGKKDFSTTVSVVNL